MSRSQLKRSRTSVAHSPINLTAGKDVIEYTLCPRSRKRLRVIDLTGEDRGVKSDLQPVVSRLVARPCRRPVQELLLPKDDSDDDEFTDPAVDKEEIGASTIITRSARGVTKVVLYSKTLSKLAEKKTDPTALEFISSMVSKNGIQKSTFTTLPTEILLRIFGLLKKVPAVVLSLTCKRLHHTYNDISSFAVGINQSSDGQRLYLSLKSWMEPDYKWVGAFGIFVTEGRWARFLEERRTTAKLLRDMHAETKSHEEAKSALVEKKILRPRTLTTIPREEPCRALLVHNHHGSNSRENRVKSRRRV